ncbi:MAG: nitrous oxide reductase family maturation protein NosD [Sulfurospirillaceae bacterium]|nr:nitrous oxide reductase family maturation protein NosD [Sulfurospirillaceae bacterium]
MRILFIIFISFLPIFAANVLQNAIDNAEAGSLLELPAGVYKGNIVINKPLIIDGQNHKAIIEGDGNGTVIKITSSYVTLKNLTIRHSGQEHERVDAGVLLNNVKHTKVINCKLLDVLFGVDVRQSSKCVIADNYITSKPFSLGLRGDAIRLWYSNDNLIRKNRIIKSRDFVVWYSHGNLIEKNYGEYCRYSLHFMYTGKNIVKNNTFKHNSVGIFFMYSQDTIATGNVIENSLGTTGLGIGLKDASNFTIENNTMIYCARGFYLDRSPFQPGTHNYIKNNKLLYNSVAVAFHSLSIANIFKNNIIKGNIENVINDSYNAKVNLNTWDGNYWDDYQGFDKNKDGIGDTPHVEKYYADKMWLFNPSVKFFYGSPIITIINFLAKLAPLSEPVVLAVDKHPKTKIGGTL